MQAPASMLATHAATQRTVLVDWPMRLFETTTASAVRLSNASHLRPAD
jgi:hypothetical protein